MDIYVIIFFVYYLYLSFLHFFNYSIFIVVMNDKFIKYKFMNCWNLVITDSWAIDCKQKDTGTDHLSALLNGNKLTFSFVLLTK